MTRLTLPDNPSSIGVLTDLQSRSLNARDPGAAITIENCITCQGAKWFRWKDPEGNIAEFDCRCQQQYLLARWLMSSGMAKLYLRLGWDDFFSDAVTNAVLDDVVEYLTHHDVRVRSGIGLILRGTRGNGKSMLANLIVKHLIAEGHHCYVTTFSGLLEQFSSGWQDRTNARWFNYKVRNVGVLYIDDVGRERNRGPQSLGQNTLEEVIRHRVSSSLPTIITTNLTEAEVGEGYSGHTLSLLSECSIPIDVTGPDRRKDSLSRKIEEQTAGLSRPVVIR